MQELLARYPLGFAQWLIAFDYVLSHPCEVAWDRIHYMSHNWNDSKRIAVPSGYAPR